MRSFTNMKLKNKTILLFLGIILLGLSSSCQSEYSKTVRKELALGGTHNELLFDLEIGQKMQDFFDRCTALNKQKEITQGRGLFARKVLSPKKEEDPRIEMLFYGISNENKVLTGMKMRFSYIAWSPWNKELQSEKLIAPIKDSLMQWFPGNSFFKVTLEDEDQPVHIKVDGNRRIRLLALNARQLSVKIEDISNKYKQ